MRAFLRTLPTASVRLISGCCFAPLYDVGVLSNRGMLLGLDAIPTSTVLEFAQMISMFSSAALGLFERIELQRWILFMRRDSGVSDDHKRCSMEHKGSDAFRRLC